MSRADSHPGMGQFWGAGQDGLTEVARRTSGSTDRPSNSVPAGAHHLRRQLPPCLGVGRRRLCARPGARL
jgi:hypothetical protein